MKFTGLPADENFFILAGDIGGTNTSLALIELTNGSFVQREKKVYASKSIRGIEDAIDDGLPLFSKALGGKPIRGACFTAAGPVQNNKCKLTNVPWSIDGDALGKRLGFPVYVINDLSGICYGVPLLDHEDSSQLLPLKHPDGTFPAPQELRRGIDVRAVVAPGTGLGIGYLIRERGSFLAIPAEAGHIDWGPYSDETRELQKFMLKRFKKNPGVEQYISGQGIEHLFEFVVESRNEQKSEAVLSILAEKPGARGASISKNSKSDPVCAHVMELFVCNMARFCSAVALWILPKAGLYVAGGIPAKNLSWFTENDRFMKLFLENYLENMEIQLRQVPVYLAMDYGINLYGAAHGFWCLNRE